MSCNKYGWELIMESAKKLTAEGKDTFSRQDIIADIAKTHPEKADRKSLDPVIQGATINAKGGQEPRGGPFLFKVFNNRYRYYGNEKQLQTIQDLEKLVDYWYRLPESARIEILNLAEKAIK